MPNLNTLNLNSSPSCFPYRKTDCSGYDMKYWKSQNLPFISQLKEVPIELSRFSCGSNPVEFSRFILDHARSLEKMVINCSYTPLCKGVSQEVERKQEEFKCSGCL